MAKKLLFSFGLLLGFVASTASQSVLASSESNSKMCNINFSPSQIEVLRKSYIVGKKFGYELTLPAIAWQESLAGEININLNDVSAGVFHNKLSNVLTRENLKDNLNNRNKIAHKLVTDYFFAVKHAIAELNFWRKTHGNENWEKIWRSYNAGYRIESAAAERYAKKISKKIYTIAKCKGQWFNGI